MMTSKIVKLAIIENYYITSEMNRYKRIFYKDDESKSHFIQPQDNNSYIPETILNLNKEEKRDKEFNRVVILIKRVDVIIRVTIFYVKNDVGNSKEYIKIEEYSSKENKFTQINDINLQLLKIITKLSDRFIMNEYVYNSLDKRELNDDLRILKGIRDYCDESLLEMLTK